MDRYLRKVREWTASCSMDADSIPLTEIARLFYHTTVETRKRAMYQLGTPEVFRAALSKLFGQPLPPSRTREQVINEIRTQDFSPSLMQYLEKAKNAPKFEDEAEGPDSAIFKAKVSMLSALGELDANVQNREDYMYDGQTAPFFVALLHRTRNDAYMVYLFKFLSYLALLHNNDYISLMHGLQAHFLYVQKGLRNIRPIGVVAIGGHIAESCITLVQYKHHICEVSLPAIEYFSTNESFRMRLLTRTDVAKKLESLPQTPDPDLNLMLERTKAALRGNRVEKPITPAAANYLQLMQEETALQKCAQCDAIGTADKRLKKCAACKQVQYCSRECQVQAWKNGHSVECKKAQEQMKK